MTLTAMLLVGGQSRRLGTDKAMLMLAGEPLWRRQLRLLCQLEPQALWISARTRPVWCPPSVEVILDEPPSRGPLSGIAAALSRLRTSHLLALGVDMPRMTLEFLKKLTTMPGHGAGVIPENDGWFEPLGAVYPVLAAAAAAHAITQSDDASMQNFARLLCGQNLLRSYALSESERSLYLNVNTPGDLPDSGLAPLFPLPSG